MSLFAQVPSVEELDQALNTDQLTAWDLVAAALAVLAAFVISKLVRRLLQKVLARAQHLSDEARLLISRAAGWAIILIGVVYAVVLLGFDMGPALFVILILLLVVFFAGRGLMENFAAGVVLQGTPMFAPGDEIELEDAVGEVMEITGRTVVIQTPDGKRVHVPNTKVIGDAVVNYTQLGTRRSTILVGVAYGTDLDFAQRVLEAALLECGVARDDPPPEALATEFGDSSIDFRVRFWHHRTINEEARAVDAVVRAINRAFADNGIEIPFPQRTLWWGDGDAGEETGER